jgi:hypothetical protein
MRTLEESARVGDAPTIALPTVRPPMKLESTRLVAQTLLPNTRLLR